MTNSFSKPINNADFYFQLILENLRRTFFASYKIDEKKVHQCNKNQSDEIQQKAVGKDFHVSPDDLCSLW